jgi:hypothetical protein
MSKKKEETKIYCSIGKVPKGAKLGNMEECAKTKQVRLWGLKKINPKIVEETKLPGAKTESKMEVVSKLSKLRGRHCKLKKDMEKTDSKKEKANIAKEMKELDAEILIYGKKLKVIYDLQKKQRQSRTSSKKGSVKKSSKKGSVKKSSKKGSIKKSSKKGSVKKSSK